MSARRLLLCRLSAAPRAVFLLVTSCAVLAGAGCGGNDQSTLRPASRASHAISALWWVMLIASAVIFGIVLVALLGAVLRRRGAGGEPVRDSRSGATLVLIGGLVVPCILLLALFALTLVILPKTSPAAQTTVGRGSGRPDRGLVVEITGRQWFWDVYYPGAHVRTANEIHIPVGETVTFDVTSGDVIHSLWIPELNRKMDTIPGQTNRITVRAQLAGVYRGQCAEFCGLQHANMALYVVAQPRLQFLHWLTAESRPAAQPADTTVERGQQVLLGSSCVYCHTISGTNASGQVGPDLTHLASRLSLAAGTIPNSKGYLAGWILDPQHIKPGNRMPATDLTGGQLQDLLAYLESLR